MAPPLRPNAWRAVQTDGVLSIDCTTTPRWGKLALVPRHPTSRVYARKLDGENEARLVTLACSAPPEGRRRWTLSLLADRLVALGHVEDGRLSYETVRRCLKKTS